MIENTGCINVFLTSGYLGWGELFLKALKRIHSEDIYVRIDGRSLLNHEVTLLKRIYGNLNVVNQEINWGQLATDARVTRRTFDRWRREIERGITTNKNHTFRVAISVNERYRYFPQVMSDLKKEGYDFVLHSDADVYIRRPLNRMFQIISNFDVSLYIRPNNPHRLAVVGGFLGLNLTSETETFLARWMEHIDAVPLHERWKGFGQSTLWATVCNSPDISIGDLNKIAGAPSLTKTFDSDADLWLGNAKVTGPVKVISLTKCWEDISGEQPEVSLLRISLLERLGIVRGKIREYLKRLLTKS